jgi:hypothetical protein
METLSSTVSIGIISVSAYRKIGTKVCGLSGGCNAYTIGAVREL